MSRTQRLLSLIALLAASVVVVLFVEPVPQKLAYHDFADMRTFLGIPNFVDVASNAGFLFVGVVALVSLARHRDLLFHHRRDARPYFIFFAAVALIAFGSGYYHWAPTNASLLWDRLPMSMAFMAISAAVVADRIDAGAGNGWLLATLLFLGFASLVYWYWSESVGQGDLRFYALVQFYPMLALPIIVLTFAGGRYIINHYLGLLIALYALSKVFEFFDEAIFEATGHLVSGHSLKHVTAAVATWVPFRMLYVARGKRTNPASVVD